MLKSIILFLFFIGILFIAVGYTKYKIDTKPPLIEYRYIPESFDMREINREPVTSIYGRLFNGEDPWAISQGYEGGFHRRKLFTYNDAY